MTLSRPTASKITRKLPCTTAICLGVLSIGAGAASAAAPPAGASAPVPPAGAASAPAPSAGAASAAASSQPATCPGQAFSQPFLSEKDANYYTLIQDGEFNNGGEGWTLSNGAQVTRTTRPNGTTGYVLNLPSGATAVSPPVCVTLEYPAARVSVRDVVGAEGVAVGMAYAGTNRTVASPQNVGQVHGQQTSWTLSDPINIQPQIAGPSEGIREARFVFTAGGKTSDFQLYGLWVDPRMR